MQLKIIRLLITAWLVLGSVNSFATDQQNDLWQGIRSGQYVVFIRHALAPGTSDPDNFELEECSTQRNLSKAGREQAARIGELFRENGIKTAVIYSSQWCRCMDTARLMRLGAVKELPALNSLHARQHNKDKQAAQLVLWFQSNPEVKPVILISHRATISALTGEYPASGELIVVRRSVNGKYPVVGKIKVPR